MLTFFIVQYSKRMLDRFVWFPTDLYAVIVAYIVLLAAQLAMGAKVADWRLYVLTFANAFLVAAAAAQIQDKSINPPGVVQRKEESDDGKRL